MEDTLNASQSSPSPWIVRFAALVVPGARVLDLACGSGRHARFFAAAGHPVLAVDRDPAALATIGGHAGIRTREVDLEAGEWPLAGERFGGIVVTHYLHRPLLGALFDALCDDGTLLYETFAEGNEACSTAFVLRTPEFALGAARRAHWTTFTLRAPEFALGAARRAHGRPSNPAFLLREGELLERCRDRLRVVAFEQGRVSLDGRICVLQRIAAQGRACRWPPVLPGS